MDEIRKIPPVTRLLVGSSLAVTVGSILKFVNPYYVLFAPELVFSRKLQLWRLYTSFFLGSGGLQYIFELVMLYQTANDLESRSYAHRSSDLAWQLLWSSAAIVTGHSPPPHTHRA
ncbi:hypothetical protein NLJ89_g11425 [Agrocybe chaxingu]|uniref:Derlin n=1 Tax=Agrocybe chaxingu TaxID=84603 RepID=A0A9W8MR66_9AGAR|nr:hypothetical protein NLJ89_g11425 [Agrocybe chaxingu]